jgi:hypothetical protein
MIGYIHFDDFGISREILLEAKTLISEIVVSTIKAKMLMRQ